MKILIIGQGNVGTHLARAFRQAGHTVDSAGMRELDGCLEDKVGSSDAGILLLCVRDSEIGEIAGRLAGFRGIVAHTSGSVPMTALSDALPGHECGVLYPLQTFSKGVAMRYDDIPFFIEGSTARACEALSALASSVSPDVYPADSAMRKRLHVAAVFACNFVNHLWSIADSWLGDSGLDFHILLPLIRMTLDKASKGAPADMQTGPASRGDTEVVAEHMRMLAGAPEMQRIYSILSESIIKERTLKCQK